MTVDKEYHKSSINVPETNVDIQTYLVISLLTCG